MRKSVFYSFKTFTQGRVPSADASTGSISYMVDDHDRLMSLLCQYVNCEPFMIVRRLKTIRYFRWSNNNLACPIIGQYVNAPKATH